MRLRTTLLATAGVVAFAVTDVCFARYSGGTGEPSDPYKIATAEDLNDISNHIEDLGKCFVLVNDINLADYTGTQFKIIGRYCGYQDPNNKPFTGVFDGNGHSISNFTYEHHKYDGAGLFGYVDDANAQIKNLTLIDPNIQVMRADEVTERSSVAVSKAAGFWEAITSVG